VDFSDIRFCLEDADEFLTNWAVVIGGGQEGIPQGLKPLFLCLLERPKAKALGYLDAKATATAKSKSKSNDRSRSPSGMTNKREGNDNSNGKRQQQVPFGDDRQERRRHGPQQLRKAKNMGHSNGDYFSCGSSGGAVEVAAVLDSVVAA
jgi:hypothetical protein